MLRAKRPNYDQHCERPGQADNPFVTVEPAHQWGHQKSAELQAQAHSDVQPKQGAALRRCDLRALNRRMTQAQILEDQGQPVERRDHRQKSEIGGGQQPGQNDHRSRIARSLWRPAPRLVKNAPFTVLCLEAVDRSVVGGIAHCAPVSG